LTVLLVNILTLILAVSAVQDHARPAHLLLSAQAALLLDTLPTMLEYVCLHVVMDLLSEVKIVILETLLPTDALDAESRLDGPAQDSPQSADPTL